LRLHTAVESVKPGLIPVSLPSDPRPVQDEWGIYDPEQAGLEAVLRKLTDEKDDSAEPDSPKPSDR